jgi:hypothetical protein
MRGANEVASSDDLENATRGVEVAAWKAVPESSRSRLPRTPLLSWGLLPLRYRPVGQPWLLRRRLSVRCVRLFCEGGGPCHVLQRR